MTIIPISCLSIILVGSFDEPNNPRPAEKKLASDDNSDALLVLRSWLRAMKEIVLAPKLLYRVERIQVFTDGVWAEYSVVNSSSTRKYLTPMFLDFPVGRMRLVDSSNRRWTIPQFDGNISFHNPDTFISVPPNGSIRFHSRVSFLTKRPLELVGPKNDPAAKPAKLRYLFAMWAHAYTRLTDTRQERVSVYAVGCGEAPVEWSDKQSPESWKSHTRIYGKD